MNALLLDCGNSYLKLSLLQGEMLESIDRLSLNGAAQWQQLDELIKIKPTQIYLSSVASKEITDALVQYCESRWQLKVKVVSVAKYAHYLPTSYEKEQLGVDRWLAMLACLLPQKASLIVDAGTAITLDYISVEGFHTGGYILPGLRSMRKALLRDTSLTPAPVQAEIQRGFAQNTAMAVELGPLKAIDALIHEMMKSDKADTVLYLSGGDAEYIQRMVSLESIKIDQLVLQGLARLVQLEKAKCDG